MTKEPWWKRFPEKNREKARRYRERKKEEISRKNKERYRKKKEQEEKDDLEQARKFQALQSMKKHWQRHKK